MKIGTILENANGMRAVIGVGGEPRWLDTGEPIFSRLNPEEWTECVVTNPEMFDSLDLLRDKSTVTIAVQDGDGNIITERPVRFASQERSTVRLPSQSALEDLEI